MKIMKITKTTKIVLIVLAVSAIVWFGRDKIKQIFSIEEIPAQEAANIAVTYINQNLLSEGYTASLLNVVEESGLYKIHIQIEDEEYDSYISKDGKLLFPQEWIDLKEESIKEEEVVGEETGQYSEETLTSLANCLTEKNFKFYGASWCGWCNKEKESFGNAAQYLPYVECSDEETQETTQACVDAGVSSFPTWGLPDGTSSSGFKTIEELSELSGCSL